MCQPTSRGRITLWPRLETGKSSDTPWSSPSIAAWKYEIGKALRDVYGAPPAEKRPLPTRLVVFAIVFGVILAIVSLIAAYLLIRVGISFR